MRNQKGLPRFVNNFQFRLGEAGVAHIFSILIIILLIVGLLVLLGLVQNPIKLFSRASISNPTGGSVIKIYAAGIAEGGVYPAMLLAKDGKYVTHWENVKGVVINNTPLSYTEYVYTFTERVTPNQISIGFSNASKNPGGPNTITRTLFVDKIKLDGIEYQTEDPTTYAEGVWVNNQCSKGFLKSQSLSCSGFFAYKAGAAPSPTPASARVFITSTTYSGNLGGLAGADAKCQSRADAAQLGGIWKAWLSDSLTSASSRLIHSNIPYKLLDGKVIANNWNDLTDGRLENPINVTELNVTPSYMSCVWTSTNANGSLVPPASNVTGCSNYTVSNSNYSLCGRNGSIDENWTNWSTDRCDQSHPLYCIEQVKGGGISAPVR